MHFTIAALVLLAAPVLATTSASLRIVEKVSGVKQEGSYIVTLGRSVSKSNHLRALRLRFGAEDKITHDDWNARVLNGFAAKLSPETIDFLRAHPEVARIEEDGIFTSTDLATETDATWGLQRISQRSALPIGSSPTALNYTYTYNSTGGAGVDVYVVDSGILTNHTVFGGRARWGATFGEGYADADGRGHGTHVAGIVGGEGVGVARAVSLVAVKVLSDKGRGWASDIIAGLNWVQTQAAASGRPSIATVSIGGGVQPAMDDAVNALIVSGVHVTVSAGNSAIDADGQSPARVAAAITVGASNITDGYADFSNFGPLVDIFAPGVNIHSAWKTDTTAFNVLNGTSQATPYVAGLAAYLISLEGNKAPADLSARIVELSTKGFLSDVPPDTVDQVAFNGAT